MKNNTFKRLIGIILVLCTVFSCLPSAMVSAQILGEGIYDFQSPDGVSGYESLLKWWANGKRFFAYGSGASNQSVYIQGYPYGSTSVDANGLNSTYEPKMWSYQKSVHGKTKDDKVLSAVIDSSKQHEKSDGMASFLEWIIPGTGSSNKTTGELFGKSAKLSFSLAFENFDLGPMIWNADYKVLGKTTTLGTVFSVNGADDVRFMGIKAQDVTLVEKQWYKFDLILTANAADSTLDFKGYINNKLVVNSSNNISGADSSSETAGFSRFRIYDNNGEIWEQENSVFKAKADAATYYDDLSYFVADDEADLLPNEIIMESSDSEYLISGDNLKIYAPQGSTVEDFKNDVNFYENGNSLTYILHKNGILLADDEAVEGAEIVITTVNNEKLYAKINKEIEITPADKSVMVQLKDLTDGIFVNYQKEMSEGTYAVGNYELYANDELVSELTVTPAENSVYIAPKDGFCYETEYRLVIKAVNNGELNEFINYEISFSTEIEGYEFPVITTDKESYEYFYGQSTDIKAAVSASKPVSKIKFTLNDDTAEEIIPESNFAVFTKNLEVGEYTLKIDAEDEIGGKAESKTVYISVIENNAPQVSFSYTDESKYFVKTGNDVITVNSSDDDGGVVKVELYVNGVLFKEHNESFDVAVSSLPAGNLSFKAVSYDSFGLSGFAEDEIIVIIDSIENIKAENVTFDTYTGDNNAFPELLGFDGNMSAATNGYVKGGFVDENEENGTGSHGKSCIFGWEEDATGSMFMGFPSGNISDKLDMEFDFYISEKAETDDGTLFAIMLRGEGGNPTDVKFTNSGVKFNNNSVLYGTIPYEEKTWYRLKYVIDFTKGIYSLYMKKADEEEFTCYGENLKKGISTSMTSFRFMAYATETPAFIGIDNVKSVITASYPYIAELGHGKSDTKGDVDISADRLMIHLSGDVDSSSVNKDRISICSKDDIAEISEVTYAAKVITVKLAKPLISNENYRIELSEKLKLSSGQLIGEKLIYDFKTLPREIDVYNGQFSEKDGKISFSAMLKNSGTKANAYVILTVFDGKEVKSTTVKKYTLNSEANIEISAPYSNGNEVQLAIWNGLKKPLFISNKIYKY